MVVKRRIKYVYFILILFISCEQKKQIVCRDSYIENYYYWNSTAFPSYYPVLCNESTDEFLSLIDQGNKRKISNWFDNNQSSNIIENMIFNEVIGCSYGFYYSIFYNTIFEYVDSIGMHSSLDLNKELWNGVNYNNNNIYYTYKFFFKSELFNSDILKKNHKNILLKARLKIREDYYLSDKDSTFFKEYFNSISENIECLESWELGESLHLPDR